MDVAALLCASKETRFSVETYPPKTTSGRGEPSMQEHISKIFDTVEHLLPYKPLFVSVTFNPEGKTKATSIPIASIIRQRFGIEALAHLTSIGIPRDELPRTLDVLDYFGITNVLALRGDLPPGFERDPGAMCHASDMVAVIKKHRRDFCVGVACYPEGHPESSDGKGGRDLAADMAHFKSKVDRGASFAISQLFLDNSRFFSFVDRARAQGIAIPIVPGIMPVVNYKNLRMVRNLCGVAVPYELQKRLDESKDDPTEVMEIGIEHAIAQCRSLMDRVPCIHFYAMNMWEPTERIIKGLK
jgi:methylenetetrahydrofolate reductase (NADPH)